MDDRSSHRTTPQPKYWRSEVAFPRSAEITVVSDSSVIHVPPQSVCREMSVPDAIETRPAHGLFSGSKLAPPHLLAACTAIAHAAGNFCRKQGAILLFLLVWQLLSQFEVVDPSVIPPVTKVF